MKTSDRAEVPRYTTTFEYLLRYPLYIDRRVAVSKRGVSTMTEREAEREALQYALQ